MKQLNKAIHHQAKLENKILQFGEGNFLRAFCDLAIFKTNKLGLTNYSIKVANSFTSSKSAINLNEQDGLYTLIESSADGQKSTIIDVVDEQFSIVDDFAKFQSYARDLAINIIISNTTEAGIVMQVDKEDSPISFPARLAYFLKLRFEELSKQSKSDKIFILPCELIDKNGSNLKKYVLGHAHNWGFSHSCLDYIESCYFYDTLVDRIVPGYPHNFISTFENEWGYNDKYATLCEEFFLWVIEGNTKELDLVLPLSKTGLNIIYTNNLSFYRNRKVLVLNGSHTLAVSISILLGEEFVADSLSNPLIKNYLHSYLYKDVFKALQGDNETIAYIESIFKRFENRYLEHRWSSISLNSLAKFKTRNLPTLLSIYKTGRVPKLGLFALASLWYYYSLGPKDDTEYHLFSESLKQSTNDDHLVELLFNNRAIYQEPLPSSWLLILKNYFKQIKSSPKIALENLLKENNE